MAQGPKLPLEIKNGRLVLLSGDDYIEQLVMVALLGGYSENPFQTLGLGDFMIFAINDSLTEGEIRQAIESVFEMLEKDQLAKLKNPDDVQMTREDDTGKMYAEISYTNMETQERSEIEVPIPPVGE